MSFVADYRPVRRFDGEASSFCQMFSVRFAHVRSLLALFHFHTVGPRFSAARWCPEIWALEQYSAPGVS